MRREGVGGSEDHNVGTVARSLGAGELLRHFTCHNGRRLNEAGEGIQPLFVRRIGRDLVYGRHEREVRRVDVKRRVLAEDVDVRGPENRPYDLQR